MLNAFFESIRQSPLWSRFLSENGMAFACIAPNMPSSGKSPRSWKINEGISKNDAIASS